MDGWRNELADPNTQTRWERGKASAALHYQSHPGFSFLYTVVPALLAAIAVPASIGLRLVVAFMAASLGWILTPYLWATVVALAATKPQRDEARSSLLRAQEEMSAMAEAHSHAVAEMEQKREAECRATAQKRDEERRTTEQMHNEEMASAKREVMNARLQLVNSGRGAIEQAIRKLRSAETLEDERSRAREMRAVHMQEMLIYWARDAHVALSAGGRPDLADQFLLEGCDLSTADRVEEVYTRLIGIVTCVLTPN